MIFSFFFSFWFLNIIFFIIPHSSPFFYHHVYLFPTIFIYFPLYNFFLQDLIFTPFNSSFSVILPLRPSRHFCRHLFYHLQLSHMIFFIDHFFFRHFIFASFLLFSLLFPVIHDSLFKTSFDSFLLSYFYISFFLSGKSSFFSSSFFFLVSLFFYFFALSSPWKHICAHCLPRTPNNFE